MSLTLEPSDHLGFQPSRSSTSTLKITNPNHEPVVYKVMVSVRKVFYIRPHLGILYPQESIDVEVERWQAVYSDPPTGERHKLVILSTPLRAGDGKLSPYDIMAQTDSSQIRKQKIRLNILPPQTQREGPTNISTASTSRPLTMARTQSLLSANTAVSHTCLLQSDIDEFMTQMAVVQREIARLQAIHARLTVRTPTPQTPTTATIASSSSKGSWFKRLYSKFG